MFRELVELGRELESERKLPPESFADYGPPIEWTVHLWPDHVLLRQSQKPSPKPFSTRTVNIEANLLADEASYCFGVSKKADGGHDAKAAKKLAHFQSLYRNFLDSPQLLDPNLREAIGWLDETLTQQRIVSDPQFDLVTSKQWVSFMPEEGVLKGQHLFEHADARSFWSAEKRRRCVEPELRGQCGVCGKVNQPLLRKLPLQVELGVRNPLQSLNKQAFVSYVSGTSAPDITHLGICFDCGDIASRAFDYLGESEHHRKLLIRHPDGKRDSLANQYAVFWLKSPQAVQIGEQLLDLDEIDFPALLGSEPTGDDATLLQLLDMLNLPWKPRESALRLTDSGFYLALLSPNVGRIALREWLSVDIARVKEAMRRYLVATQVVSPVGDSSAPLPLSLMLAALGNRDPNLTRDLLRCAYSGVAPPSGLLGIAGGRLNQLLSNEQTMKERQLSKKGEKAPDIWKDAWPMAAAGAVKLARFWATGEAETMVMVNPMHDSVGYHCGRLFAVLEEAQQVYSYHQTGERLKTSIVQRAYGGAAEAPKSVLGQLFKVASTAHLPDAGRGLQLMAEEISSRIVELGGAPVHLSIDEQADFGLGFYQQRAEIRARRSASKSPVPAADSDVPDAIDKEETSDAA